MTLKWYGTAIERKFAREMHKRTTRSVQLIEQVAKRSMTRGGRTESGYSAKEGEKLARTGSFASKPGEPPRRQSGTLARSITHEVEPKATGFSTQPLFVGRVGTNLNYGKHLEMGTRPYTIRAKNASVLAKRIGAQGWIVFGKKVNHPGIKPRPWLRPAWHRSQNAIKAIFRRPIDRI